ncbi:MAG: endopeptidase La [Planctomycetota bacterium]
MSELQKLPVLALRNAVLFPGVTAPFGVGRAASAAAVRAALARDDKLIFVVLQKEDQDAITADSLHTQGTVARVLQVEQARNNLKLLVQGEYRGVAIRYDLAGDHLVAAVDRAQEFAPERVDHPLVRGLELELRSRAVELAGRIGLAPPVIEQALSAVKELGPLADVVASYLEIDAAEKQVLLQTLSVEERLRRVLVHVQRLIEVREAQEDIKSRVQQELGDRQREMVLREQMKAIQRELGEQPGGDGLDELQRKIEALQLPPDVRKTVDRDLRRLLQMGTESMEAQVLRTYLETVAELPWSARSEEKLDVLDAARILDEDHYGLADVKDRVVEHLAVLRLRADRAARNGTTDTTPADAIETAAASGAASAGPAQPEASEDRELRAPILLFTGPPGVGKTSIAKSIAHATGREYVRISLGGARDEADIRGHRRTYVGAMPGRIVQGLRQAGTRNPVFLLDEIDKLGISHQGDPAAALLEVLDPAQNNSFVDHYLGVPFDLSEVLFIATANYVQNIPAPLLDRMEVVDFSGYTEAEKLEIARRYLWPRQLRANALDALDIAITDAALARVITYYTREAGVRQLEKELGKLSRKIVRRVTTTDASQPVRIDTGDISTALGQPKVRPEQADRDHRVGVATGMFYTPVGGDIMFVEATTMRGKGELVLTGQLGEVMRESARAAWSYARSHAPEFLIEASMFDRDIHIHVPAGAIPKDGPSAGVTLATALVSALSGVAVRSDIAMTGEITLTGRVLPIGGVKEKVLGAVRAGIRKVILPKQNEDDLRELPEEVRASLEIYPVEQLDAVFDLALTAGVFRPTPALG